MVRGSMLPGHPDRNPPAETMNRLHHPVRNAQDMERNQAAVARQAEDAALRKVRSGPTGAFSKVSRVCRKFPRTSRLGTSLLCAEPLHDTYTPWKAGPRFKA